MTTANNDDPPGPDQTCCCARSGAYTTEPNYYFIPNIHITWYLLMLFASPSAGRFFRSKRLYRPRRFVVARFSRRRRRSFFVSPFVFLDLRRCLPVGREKPKQSNRRPYRRSPDGGVVRLHRNVALASASSRAPVVSVDFWYTPSYKSLAVHTASDFSNGNKIIPTFPTPDRNDHAPRPMHQLQKNADNRMPTWNFCYGGTGKSQAIYWY